MNVGGKRSGVLNIGVSGFNPKKIRIRSKLLGAFSRSREAGLVMIEAFTSSRDIARPDNRLISEGVGKIAALGHGEVRVGLDLFPVCVDSILRCALSFQMGINS